MSTIGEDWKGSIIALTADIRPLDAREAQHLDAMTAWLRSTDGVFRRVKPATPDRHLVVYCVPVDFRAEKIFLGWHRGAQRWLPPGGHVDQHEHPRDTAVREACEELGVNLDPHCVWPVLASIETTVGDHPHTDMTLWFVFESNASTTFAVAPEEFSTARWTSFAEVAGLDTNPNVNRFLEKLQVSR